jgi:hypothetical protein
MEHKYAKIKDFYYRVNKDKILIAKYKILAIKYNIVINYCWEGTANYYGIFNNNPISNISMPGKGTIITNLTDLEEFFIDNIEKEKNNTIDDFCFRVNYNESLYKIYKELAIKYNIPIKDSNVGNAAYYGIQNNEPSCLYKSWVIKNRTFNTRPELEQFFINQNQLNKSKKGESVNEKIRSINTERRNSNKGSSIVSNPTRRTTIGSRPTGNKTSTKHRKAKLVKSAIKPNIITI